MRTTFFIHNMKSSRRLKRYAEEKFRRAIGRFTKNSVDVRTAFDFNDPIFRATCHVQGSGIAIHISKEAESPYAAVDALTDRLQRSLRKRKEKSRTRRIRAHEYAAAPIANEGLEQDNMPGEFGYWRDSDDSFWTEWDTYSDPRSRDLVPDVYEP